MRLVLSLVLAALALPVHAGEPYTPVPLRPAEVVTPPAELIEAATRLLAAVESGDGAAIAAGIAPTVTAVDGALELTIPRRREIIGPTDTIESLLVELARYIGGDYERPANGVGPEPYAVRAERQYIVAALTDGRPWGTDPMLEGAICTYGYRSFDPAAVQALAEKLGVSGSSFTYVEAVHPLLAEPDAGAATIGMLQPDRLYALDYDTRAPGRWMAIHMPEGGSGFVNFDEVNLEKPYAAGICFSQDEAGKWVMSGQVATSL
jgi:hypothetical protein